MEHPFDIKLTFLGSKSENSKLIKELINKVLDSVIQNRIEINKQDDEIFESSYIESESYKESKEIIINKTNQLLEYLKDSILFSSPRVQSFMIGDTTIASLIGNISTLFYNETPVTYTIANTILPLEFIVVQDMCSMIGFEIKNPRDISFNIIDDDYLNLIQEKGSSNDSIQSSGHLTTGGSICNIEALWCSLYIKFIPISIKHALLNEQELLVSKDQLKINKDLIYSNDYLKFMVDGVEIELIKLSNWDLLNINSDESTRLPFVIAKQCQLKIHRVYELIKKYHPYSIGIYQFFNSNNLNPPVFIIPESSHYSLGKASILLGLGIDSGIKYINLDNNRRMDINQVKDVLNECYKNRIPIINLTCICGSTQEGSVDHIDQILQLRDQFRSNKKLTFDIHVDGAFGGFFLSMIRDDFQQLELPNQKDRLLKLSDQLKPLNLFKSDLFESELILNQHLIKQLNSIKYCDSVTIDFHKHGFINFTSGGIFFRNEKFKYILSISPIYIGGNSIETTGIYGIEGSRNGQSVSACYLTNNILRPSKGGYGRLLKRSLLNSKIFYLGLLCLNELKSSLFKVYTMSPNPNSNDYEYLKFRIFGSSVLKDELIFPNLNEINWDSKLLKIINRIGPDLSVINFGFSPINNKDYNKLHQLNKLVSTRFSHLNAPHCDLLLSSTVYGLSKGIGFINNLLDQIGIKDSIPNSIYNTSVPFVRSVLMDVFVNETIGNSIYTNIFKLLKDQSSSSSQSLSQLINNNNNNNNNNKQIKPTSIPIII